MRIAWACILSLSIVPIAALGASAHALVTYLDIGDGAQPSAMAADSGGNLFVVSYVTEPSGRRRFRVTKVDPHLNIQISMDFGASAADYEPTGFNSIAGVAIDPKGNVVIAGTTGSPDFPLVRPLISKTSQEAAFIVKIDSQLQNILFSTRLGGTSQTMGGGTSAGALALDANGNIYLTGGTSDSDFPVTPSAFQTLPPPTDKDGSAVYAYVTEISADGTKIIFSTYFGADHYTCPGGLVCGAHGLTSGTAVALDAKGNLVVAGNTNTDQLPVTRVPGPTCGVCANGISTAFLAKFGSGGSTLLWATYVLASESLQAMALDNTGNIIIAGSSYAGFPVTAGALQPTFPMTGSGAPAGFVAKIDSSAQRLVFSSYFGGGPPCPLEPVNSCLSLNGVAGLAVDSQGTIWITGLSAPEGLPVAAGTPLLGSTYVASLSEDGSAIVDIATAPDGAAGQAIVLTAGGAAIALGLADSLLTVIPGPGPSLVGVANAATSSVSPAVAPDELISLYGIGIGPSTPAAARVVNGVVTTSLSGVQVLFDGVPAPLLYVGPDQINAVVPIEVAGHDTTALIVVSPAGPLPGLTMSVRPARPGVFTNPGTSSAAALNADGSVNSSTNPAQPGSVVTVWGTGAGTGTQTFFGIDGLIAEGAGDRPSLPTLVLGAKIDGLPGFSAEVLYAGDAPGTVTGVVQVNFRLPSQLNVITAPQAFFQLQIGDAASAPFSIYVSVQHP